MADVPINLHGAAQTVPEGTTVAAALLQQGLPTRTSVTGEPRAPLCGMGICFECRVTIDGEAQRLSCQTPCLEGMQVQAEQVPARCASKGGPCLRSGLRDDFEIIVVGGGPAGLAAAVAAASHRRVLLLDDNPAWGGQIWRGEATHPTSTQAQSLFKQATQAKVKFLPGARVFSQPAPGRLWIEVAGGRHELTFQHLILAPGARERFLPFPGWTLPGVMGAGGLQALVKGGLSIANKKVVVAGSGPLLLAVAAYLKKSGASVLLIAEQAPRGRLARFALNLLRDPGKLWQALGLKWQLKSVPYRMGCWPVEAHGKERLEAVTLTNGRRAWRAPCDYLACGFGLVPNVELPLLIGCEVKHGAVLVNELQETSMRGIYCAGETAGIGGLDCALVEGRMAGLAAADRVEEARRLLAAKVKARRFALALEETFALREELKALARPDTFVCRCEDVSLESLASYQDWRAAKLQTRCGMGPCQGRVCGPALEFLRGWKVESIRPPVLPARVESFS